MRLYKKGITVLGGDSAPQQSGQVSGKVWTVFGLMIAGLFGAAIATSFGSDKPRRKKR